VGTVANTLLVGTFVDLLLRLGSVCGLTHHGLGIRTGLLVLGLVLIGVGSGFYIGAAMGAGPRDSLMLVLWRRTGLRVGGVRAAIEVSALAVGIALGGTFGVGTIAFAALVGPCIEASFALLKRSPLVASIGGVTAVDPLRQRLADAFPDASELSVEDRTGSGDHFQVVVASPRFEGLSLVEQHRLVYDALADPLRDGTIHELRIRTKGSE
jgi:stress-induced morphogen